MRVGGKTNVGRHRTLRTLITAFSVAALGACSGVSPKNDPEAERIVKRVIQEEEDLTELPLGAKGITGNEDATVVAKMEMSISGFGDRQNATFDAAWRTDADKKFTSSIANLTVSGFESHTGEKSLSTSWTKRPCHQILQTC